MHPRNPSDTANHLFCRSMNQNVLKINQKWLIQPQNQFCELLTECEQCQWFCAYKSVQMHPRDTSDTANHLFCAVIAAESADLLTPWLIYTGISLPSVPNAKTAVDAAEIASKVGDWCPWVIPSPKFIPGSHWVSAALKRLVKAARRGVSNVHG